jgi:hypothetical protein
MNHFNSFICTPPMHYICNKEMVTYFDLIIASVIEQFHGLEISISYAVTFLQVTYNRFVRIGMLASSTTHSIVKPGKKSNLG